MFSNSSNILIENLESSEIGSPLPSILWKDTLSQLFHCSSKVFNFQTVYSEMKAYKIPYSHLLNYVQCKREILRESLCVCVCVSHSRVKLPPLTNQLQRFASPRLPPSLPLHPPRKLARYHASGSSFSYVSWVYFYRRTDLNYTYEFTFIRVLFRRNYF